MRFLSREEVNNGRQFNLDLLKATAIVFMILCHPVLEFTQTCPVEAMGSIWYYTMSKNVLVIYCIYWFTFFL